MIMSRLDRNVKIGLPGQKKCSNPTRGDQQEKEYLNKFKEDVRDNMSFF